MTLKGVFRTTLKKQRNHNHAFFHMSNILIVLVFIYNNIIIIQYKHLYFLSIACFINTKQFAF